MTVLLNRRLNGRLFAVSPSTAVAPPSQVGGLAAGAVTPTSILVTYNASSGAPPISYAGYTSPHGVSTWTLNAGAFSATGGTFVNLSPSTNYDLQVIATNSAGSTATILSNGVSTTAATVAPSQVGSLVAGVPTTSTIPVTYSAPTGSAPITYAGYTSPHGVATWTLNAGTFAATGGTFVNLSPGTNYDLQINAINSAGASTTTLTSGVTTASIAATAPSQVGNLASGVPTAFTIPITYTAPSGTAPLAYIGFTSPHGANSWTQNAGSFTSVGGVFYGLMPATTYDLRIVVSNSAGSSTTNLTNGVTTAAAPSFTGAANRYDIIMGASAAAPGSAVSGSLYPNGTWSGQTITLAPTTGAGAVSPATITTPNGSSAPISFTYIPSAPGEHAIGGANNGSLYNPYPAPLNVFTPSSGASQSLTVAVATTNNGQINDPQPRQYDTLATLAQGFSFSGAKGYGSVALNVSAIGGATTGLWVKLYDANSAGAGGSVGSGTPLTSSPVQVYGSLNASGVIRVLLPASLYYYYVDIATDAAFTAPVRVPQRIVVGLVIGMIGRSQEAGFAQWYYDNTTPTGETWTNTLVRYGSDARYEPNYSGYYRQTGAAQTDSHADGSDPNGPSGGAQAAGRIIAATMGVNLAIVGIAATGGGVDSFINHDGSLSLAATFTFNDAGIDGKFRWLWAASLDGWDNANSAYPGSFGEYQTRYIAAMDWVARTYPACAVQGWGGGGTGRPEPNGSAQIAAGVTDNPGPGAARLQSIFLNQVEPINPMVVSKENYAWAAFDGGHGDTGSRRIYTQTGLRQLISAELAINGGLQTPNRGPTLLATGTASQSARSVRIYGKLNGGGGLQTVQITQQKPNYTVTFGQATASQLADLFAVYGPGGYSGNGLPIKITGVAINYTNLPSGADFSLDATLAGVNGVTYSDGSTSAFPSSLAVQYAADLQASGGNGYIVQFVNGGTPGPSLVTMICDTQVNGPWEWGRHIRPQLDIAITVGS